MAQKTWTVNVETGTRSLDLAVELQDRVSRLDAQVFLQALIRPDRIQLLRPARHDDLVFRAQKVEQRGILQVIRSKPRPG